MKAKALKGLCGALLVAAFPIAGQAAKAKPSATALEAENRRLAEELRKTQAELERYKSGAVPAQAPAETASPNREIREMNAPLPPSGAEQEAAAGGGKDFTVAVGLKLWINEWNTWRTPNLTIAGLTPLRGANVSTLTSDSHGEVSPIPSLTVRYKDFFLSGSYLTQTDYSFPEQTDKVDFQNSAITFGYKLAGSRKEWDVILGYQILPGLALTTGYKEINQAFYQEGCAASFAGASQNCPQTASGNKLLDARVTYGGPTLGITGSAALDRERFPGLGVYGSFAYGWLGANYTRSGAAQSVGDVDYYVGELGFTYTHLLKEMPVYLPLSSATAYAGYRYQSYESHIKDTNGNNPKDVVQGFVTGLNFAY